MLSTQHLQNCCNLACCQHSTSGPLRCYLGSRVDLGRQTATKIASPALSCSTERTRSILELLACRDVGSHPSCYEVRVDAPGQKMPVLSLRCAAARPGKGDAVCSLVPMRHADTAISVANGKIMLTACSGTV